MSFTKEPKTDSNLDLIAIEIVDLHKEIRDLENGPLADFAHPDELKEKRERLAELESAFNAAH